MQLDCSIHLLGRRLLGLTVNDTNPALPRTLDFWNYGIFLIMVNAGFISSTVVSRVRIEI